MMNDLCRPRSGTVTEQDAEEITDRFERLQGRPRTPRRMRRHLRDARFREDLALRREKSPVHGGTGK